MLRRVSAVETTHGVVRGAQAQGLEVFRGIPYARPPLGPLRFRAPEAPEPWKGELDATEFGPAPPQQSDVLAERLGLFPTQPLSEDCLTLNVWTPSVGAGARPVLFWIHGGAFSQGAGSIPLYSGEALARRGDVVVVTLNYRVGALGFLYLGGLGGEADLGGGNFGLLDQLAALRWVQREIAAFGGDPANVTVFGESAGAGSITSLLAMPSAAGLFRRAIVQSASPEGMLDSAEAERRTGIFLGKLGLEKGQLSKLRELPCEALQKAQTECAAEGPYSKGMLYLPVVDGELLPAMPMDRIAQGSARSVDLMIGTTQDELRLFQLTSPPEAMTDQLLELVVAAQLPPTLADARAEASRIIARYRELLAERGEAAAPSDLFCAIQTDLSMRYPSTLLAERQAEHVADTYMYLFTQRSPCEGGSLGACHALDIPFVMGTLDAPGMCDFAGEGDEVLALSEGMMDAWLQFARCGNPGRSGVPWPRYESGSRSTMSIGKRWRVVNAPFEAERVLWQELSARAGL